MTTAQENEIGRLKRKAYRVLIQKIDMENTDYPGDPYTKEGMPERYDDLDQELDEIILRLREIDPECPKEVA